MSCTHTGPARGVALGLAAVLVVTSPIVLAAPAPALPSVDDDAATDSASEPAAPAAAAPADAANSAVPPPMVTPATPGWSGTTTPPVKRVNKGSLEQGLELSDQADRKFDEGDYAEAARLYTRTLNLLSENDSNHVTRSIVLANGVTAYEYLYATTGDVEMLRRAKLLLQDYLRNCKTKWGTRCDAYSETLEAQSRLKKVMASIDRAAPLRPKIPPEVDTAPGGKSYDLTVDLPPPPAWIGPAFVGGVLLSAAGSVVIWHGATSDNYGPIVERSLLDTNDTADTADTGLDTGVDTDGTTDTTTDGTTTSSSSGDFELSPDTKGKLIIGLGTFLAVAGVGAVILSAMSLAKHRRINRSRAQQLALVPAVGRGSAGFVLSGRF